MVDADHQAGRLGSDLLLDAARRGLTTTDLIGARAVVVQSTDERTRSFYSRPRIRLFSQREPLTLLLRTSEFATLLRPYLPDAPIPPRDATATPMW